MESQNQGMMTWTKPRLERLKTAYARALNEGMTKHQAFKFEGYVMIVAYAKYLIEYLDYKLEE